MTDWQTIDSAPRDGTKIMFFGRWKPFDIHQGGQPEIGLATWGTLSASHNEDDYQWFIDYSLNGATPMEVGRIKVDWTHWQPLPPPPEDSQ